MGSQHISHSPILPVPLFLHPDRLAIPSLPLCLPQPAPYPLSTWPPLLPSSSPGSSFYLPIKSSPQNPLLVSNFRIPRIKDGSISKHPGQDFLPHLSHPQPD